MEEAAASPYEAEEEEGVGEVEYDDDVTASDENEEGDDQLDLNNSRLLTVSATSEDEASGLAPMAIPPASPPSPPPPVGVKNPAATMSLPSRQAERLKRGQDRDVLKFEDDLRVTFEDGLLASAVQSVQALKLQMVTDHEAEVSSLTDMLEKERSEAHAIVTALRDENTKLKRDAANRGKKMDEISNRLADFQLKVGKLQPAYTAWKMRADEEKQHRKHMEVATAHAKAMLAARTFGYWKGEVRSFCVVFWGCGVVWLVRWRCTLAYL